MTDKKITDCKEMVKNLLTSTPHTRDDDNRLIANFWWAELDRAKKKGCNSTELLKMLSEGQLTSGESITRMRRKLQEEFAELRGKLYEERQARQNPVKKELGYKTND